MGKQIVDYGGDAFPFPERVSQGRVLRGRRLAS